MQIDTSNILFICGGAFVGLEKIIEQRIGKKNHGVWRKPCVREKDITGSEILSQVQPEDLLKFGLIPEFIGRLPVTATLEDLERNGHDPDIDRAKKRTDQAIQEIPGVGKGKTKVHRQRNLSQLPKRR